MKTAFQILRDTLKDVWADLWTVLVCNLLWIVSVLLIIPGPPATLALFYYGNRLARGEVADLGDYWSAFRRNWWTGWRWGLVNLVVIVILAADYNLTGQLSQSSFTQFAQGFYLAVLAGWLILQFYALPFLFEQEAPSVRQALRNGAVMIGKNPGFALALTGLLFVAFILGTVLFMLSFAFGGVILSVAASRAIQNRLEIFHRAVSDIK
jgi:uncharacterized membrane protein YesL